MQAEDGRRRPFKTCADVFGQSSYSWSIVQECTAGVQKSAERHGSVMPVTSATQSSSSFCLCFLSHTIGTLLRAALILRTELGGDGGSKIQLPCAEALSHHALLYSITIYVASIRLNSSYYQNLVPDNGSIACDHPGMLQKHT